MMMMIMKKTKNIGDGDDNDDDAYIFMKSQYLYNNVLHNIPELIVATWHLKRAHHNKY